MSKNENTTPAPAPAPTPTPIHMDESNYLEFLGTVLMGDTWYDIYYKNTNEHTIIARYGSGGEYLSGIEFGRHAYQIQDFTHPLAIAYALVKDRLKDS